MRLVKTYRANTYRWARAVRTVSVSAFLGTMGFSASVFATSNGYYLNFGVDYNQNLAKGSVNNIVIYNGPDAVTIQVTNARESDGPSVSVEAGRDWSMTSRWSLGLGVNVRKTMLTQSGVGDLAPIGAGSYQYQYDIDVLEVTPVGRLLYGLGKWQYYGEFGVGASRLDSNNYHVVSGGDSYTSKSVWRLSYTANLGVMYRIAKQTSLGLRFGYTDLGMANLGGRALGDGHIEQKLHVLNGGITVTHWF